jgi:hypothetical protein
MRNLFQNKVVFTIGFIFGLLLFAALNLFAIRQVLTNLCHHCFCRIGFPFAFYEGCVFRYPERVLWIGLIADILIALAFSLATAFTFTFVRTRINFPSLRLK